MGTQILLLLLGSVALLVWGVRMVRTGVLRAFGAALRRLLAAASRERAGAFAGGVLAAAALQSSTAVAVIIGGFAGQGLIGTAPALAILLGTDVGTALAAQLLAMDVKWLWAVLLAGGVPLFLTATGERRKGIARLVIGLGLVLLALSQMGLAAGLLRESPTVRLVLATLGAEPLLAFLLAALLTWLVHSSLAIVLLVISLAASGLVGPGLSVALVLGANAGRAAAPLLALSAAGPAARRVALGNLGMRGGLALLALPLAGPLGEGLEAIFAAPALRVGMAHLAFNLLVALVFLPLIPSIGRWLDRLLPRPSRAPMPTSRATWTRACSIPPLRRWAAPRARRSVWASRWAPCWTRLGPPSRPARSPESAPWSAPMTRWTGCMRRSSSIWSRPPARRCRPRRAPGPWKSWASS
jgi:phosphate:Na+ symporter